jgi:hypothetical protein
MIYSSSYHYEKDHIEFSETNESNGHVMHFTLQSLGPEKSGLVIDYYVPKSVKALSFKLFESKSLRERLERSLQRLGDFLKTHRIK